MPEQRLGLTHQVISFADHDPEREHSLAATLECAQSDCPRTVAHGVCSASEHTISGSLGYDHHETEGFADPMPLSETAVRNAAHCMKGTKPPKDRKTIRVPRATNPVRGH